tara:strand:- start:18048 stop:18473 length:426 start_codon:yes stop_codon:yes gene_type:complete
MGNYNSVNKISFYDMQIIVNSNNNNYIIINTLEEREQNCLITNTLTADMELQLFNNNNTHLFLDKNIIIYGKNCNCNKIYDKYHQIKKMGFINVYLYPGGLFEWLLLQDIYGDENFPTTIKELDILKYKPDNIINNFLLLH